LYFGRFSSVHIGDPSANQATSFEIQLIQSIQEVLKRTLRGSHKSSGLSARTLNRMLAAPLLGERARAKILEYIVAKKAGHYGSNKLSLRRFDQRLAA